MNVPLGMTARLAAVGVSAIQHAATWPIVASHYLGGQMPTAAEDSECLERTRAVLGRLVPLVRVQGATVGSRAVRWVAPPWSAALLSEAPNRLEIRRGHRQLLAVEWASGYVRVGYFAPSAWDRELLELLQGSAEEVGRTNDSGR